MPAKLTPKKDQDELSREQQTAVIDAELFALLDDLLERPPAHVEAAPPAAPAYLTPAHVEAAPPAAPAYLTPAHAEAAPLAAPAYLTPAVAITAVLQPAAIPDEYSTTAITSMIARKNEKNLARAVSMSMDLALDEPAYDPDLALAIAMSISHAHAHGQDGMPGSSAMLHADAARARMTLDDGEVMEFDEETILAIQRSLGDAMHD